MNPSPLDWLDQEAEDRRGQGLDRRIVVRDPHLINFASNDYLGLAADPRVIEAARKAAERFGFGSGASPLVSGWTEAHESLVKDLAEFEQVEAVALFPTGFAANLGVIASLVEKGDAVYLDRLNHACLIDGARMSGATLRVYPHNDSERLDAILARDRGRFRRFLVATDSVFSMDGDTAPLEQISEICERHGAIMLVDEAHGTGVFGPDGRGACAEAGVADRIHVRVGTLSKALGSLGGFVAGSRRLVDHLINRSRTHIYSTALPPACAAAASESLRISRVEPWRRERIHRAGDALRADLRSDGWEVPHSRGPIVPVIAGEAGRAVGLASALRNEGFLVPSIRPPTVPTGTSRLRISLSAALSDDQITRLVAAMNRLRGSIC